MVGLQEHLGWPSSATWGLKFKKNTVGLSFCIGLYSAENKNVGKDYNNKLDSSVYINQAEINNFILVYKKTKS